MRSRLFLPAAAGTVTAAVLAHTLATRTATAEIRGHTMSYALHVPQTPLLLAGYLLATVGSLLLAGDRLLRYLGVLVGAGAAVCALLWRSQYVSTWCAPAAVASVVLLAWVRRPARRAARDPAPLPPDRTPR